MISRLQQDVAMHCYFAVIAAIHFCSSFLYPLSAIHSDRIGFHLIRRSVSLTYQTEVAFPAPEQAASDASYPFAPQTAAGHSSNRHDRPYLLPPTKISKARKEGTLKKAGW